MGTHLATGIIAKVLMSKADIERKSLHMKDIHESLQRELDLSSYIFQEKGDIISWEIKPEMLEGNLAEFLRTQFMMYDGVVDKEAQLAIDAIKKAQTGDKIIEFSKENRNANFQMISHLYGDLSVQKSNGFSDYLDIQYHMMAFFIDGKIIMECYNSILHYFEQNIRLQAKEYPIVNCVKTMITS